MKNRIEKLSPIVNGRCLVDTFELFKEYPNRVFVCSDFKHKKRNYMVLLMKMGLIEQVGAIYYSGGKYVQRREVKGYKLKKLEAKE